MTNKYFNNFMQQSLEHLEAEIELLKSRNTRVEQEKKWEGSWQRKISIIIVTYFVMILVFWSLGNPEPVINAIVPTLGYILSTLSMDWMKKLFLREK
jgi:ribosomal protein L11 methylase PrmA